MSSSTGTPDIFASGSTSNGDDDDDEVMSEVDAELVEIPPVVEAEIVENALPLERRSPTRKPHIPSSQRISELTRVEEKLAEILGHASSAIALYAQPPDEVDQDGDSPGSLASVLEAYYSGVDDVQRSLRTSVAQLRAARISPRILFQSGVAPSSSTHASSVGIGDQRRSYADADAGAPDATGAIDLSLEATAVEKQAWKDALEALGAFNEGKPAI